MSPLLELVGAIVPRLKGDGAVSALVAERILDRVPLSAVFPYASFGSAWEIQDDAECIGGVEIGFRIDVWSRAVGLAETSRIANAVRRALHNAEMNLAENALVMIEHRRTDTMRDPDGLTTHAALEFMAVIETA